jgi:hypothetical protein
MILAKVKFLKDLTKSISIYIKLNILLIVNKIIKKKQVEKMSEATEYNQKVLNAFIDHSVDCVILGENDGNKYRNANVGFLDGAIVIKQKGMFTGNSKGQRTIPYNDITSVNLDLNMIQSYLTLYVHSEQIKLRFTADKSTPQWIHDLIIIKQNEPAEEEVKEVAKIEAEVENNYSVADEILKLKKLLDDEIIDQDEFKELKRKLIENL